MSEHVRILLVGDGGVDETAVLSEIERSGLDHEVARAKGEPEMIDACRHGRPDIVLALDSDETFDAVAAMAVSQEMCAGIPLIVIANAAGEEVAVEALKAGATDYIISDRLGRLASAIERALAQAHAGRARDAADIALRESEARFRGIFENSPIGITIRRGPRLIYLNPAYLSLIGYPDLDSVPDHSLLSLVAPEYVESQRETFVSLMPREGTFEERALRSDGTTFPTEVTVTNVELSDGPATVAFVADITERKHAEEELDRYSRDLERMVKARTDQLLEADAALQRATDTRIRFLSSMSHELRVPLNSVIGFSGVLLQGLPGPLTGEQRRQIEIIMAAGRRLTATIDDVLDISGIEAGKAELEWDQFELDTMIASLADEYEPPARERGVEIVMCRPDTPVRIVSDRRKVGKIVQELLENAAKFTPVGSIHVSLVEDSDSVSVSVRDTGIGIAAADLPLIFEEFQQAKLPDGGRPDGSGLGLAICHRLAELLGGSLTVVSEQGSGAEFTLHLPRGPVLDVEEGGA